MATFFRDVLSVNSQAAEEDDVALDENHGKEVKYS